MITAQHGESPFGDEEAAAVGFTGHSSVPFSFDSLSYIHTIHVCMINFEWDDRKDRTHQRKHEVSFDQARTGSHIKA